MGDLTALVDVAIGLTVVYLGASLFVTIINEFVAQALNLRGKALADHLKKLIDEPQLQKALGTNPALASFFNGQAVHSYADPNLVARLLLAGLPFADAKAPTIDSILAAIDGLPNPSGAKSQLAALARSGASDAAGFVKAVSEWVDRTLTTMGESYRGQTKVMSFGIGVIVAVCLNLNSVTLTDTLYRDKTVRQSMVSMGEAFVAKVSPQTFEDCLKKSAEERRSLPECGPIDDLAQSLRTPGDDKGAATPFGWTHRPTFSDVGVTNIVGWLLTGLAISLGAPFWFETLNRIVNVRHGMRRPQVDDEK